MSTESTYWRRHETIYNHSKQKNQKRCDNCVIAKISWGLNLG